MYTGYLRELLSSELTYLLTYLLTYTDNVPGRRCVAVNGTTKCGAGRIVIKSKGKVCHTPTGVYAGCSSPFLRPWARRWRTTNVCDAWPLRRQTYGYFPSRKASPPIGWYQIILLGDRGTCVLTTCPGLHSIAERPGFELATYWSS